MTDIELKHKMDRVTRYNALKQVRDEIQGAISMITDPWEKTGPAGQGPFTGNTRESRRVSSMHINFTATRGGAHAVDISINGLNIEAYDVGQTLLTLLRVKLGIVQSEMEKI